MPTTTTLTHWGPFLVEGDSERIHDIHDHPADPDSSPIGKSLIAATECRVAKPSIRKSWLEGGPGHATELRGREAFVEVEWDEALDLVAAELGRVRQDHGNASIFGGSYGWGSAGRIHMPSSVLHRFLRLFGGATDQRGTYSSSAAEVIVPYVIGIGYHAAVAQQTSWGQIAEHTELFVSFGGLRLTNTQVTYGGQGPHHTGEWLDRCAERGVEFLNVSPLADDQLDRVNGSWVGIRPGTDVALMSGIAHTLIVEGLVDQDFLDTHTVGWPALRSSLLGDGGSTARTAEWAAKITGVAADNIRDLARRMAGSRTTINLTLAVQRGDHGEQPYWMAIALAAMLGQIGLPGGGFAFPFGSAGNVGAGQKRKRVPGLPVPPRNKDMPIIPVSRIAEMLEQPNGEYDSNGARETFPDARLVYWVGGNPFHHHQDLNRLEQAWRQPETVIVHEPFWTPVAKRADIVLPATTPLERNDIGGAETMLIAMAKVLDPVGQARDDYDILWAIADRLDLGDEFSDGRTSDEWVRHAYEEFRSANDYAPSFEEFWEAGTLVHDMDPMGSSDQVFLSGFRADPKANPLPTPSGRIELFSETIASFGYDDCPGHPAWIEPYERLGTPRAEQFPLHLISNQPTTRLHSQYDHAELSRDSKIQGREPMRIHPDDATARGISNGDVVRLFNDRGACLAGVIVSSELSPGIVQLSTGAWWDPDDAGMCVHGNPNALTRDKGTSNLAQGPSAHTCLIEVERFDGELPPITAFDPPELVSRR